jgi:hypothetical protein
MSTHEPSDNRTTPTSGTASPSSAPAARRPRHLLDPNDLHGSHVRSQGDTASLRRTQKWVLSVLVVTTILHLSAGVSVAAIFMNADRVGARVGLNVIAAVIGVAAVAVGMMIHGKRPLSWWLLLGLLPAVVGTWLTFG